MNGGLQENGIHESAEMLSAHVPGHPQGRVDRSRNAEGARYPHSLLEVLSIGKQAEQPAGFFRLHMGVFAYLRP